MKVTAQVENLLRQGKKPKELVEFGFPKSVVTRVHRQLREEKGGAKQKRRQAKVNAPPNGGGGIPQKGAAPIATVPLASGVDDIESDPEIVQLKKDIRKAELERELGRAKMPLEVAILVAAAREFGERRLEFCDHHEDGLCTYWEWDSQDEIPNGIGEPISGAKGVWRIKPSPLYCAICPIPLEDTLDGLNDELNNIPLRNLRGRFSCECGAKGKVALRLKCTKCGKESWWGWWPTQ